MSCRNMKVSSGALTVRGGPNSLQPPTIGANNCCPSSGDRPRVLEELNDEKSLANCLDENLQKLLDTLADRPN